MGIKALAVVALIINSWIVEKKSIVPVQQIWEERVCIASEETRNGVQYLITQCSGTDNIPLEWKILGEQCFITLNFNRQCENPNFPMDS